MKHFHIFIDKLKTKQNSKSVSFTPNIARISPLSQYLSNSIYSSEKEPSQMPGYLLTETKQPSVASKIHTFLAAATTIH